MSLTLSMRIRHLLARNIKLKLLCLTIAFTVWCLSAISRPISLELRIPLTYNNIPSGYSIVNQPPTEVVARLSGSTALLSRAKRNNRSLNISLSNAVAGMNSYQHLETHLKLPEGVTVSAIAPSSLDLQLTR